MNKDKSHVFEKNGRYYKQYTTWSEKYGIYIPQSPHRISKKEFERCMKEKEEVRS